MKKDHFWVAGLALYMDCSESHLFHVHECGDISKIGATLRKRVYVLLQIVVHFPESCLIKTCGRVKVKTTSNNTAMRNSG